MSWEMLHGILAFFFLWLILAASFYAIHRSGKEKE